MASSRPFPEVADPHADRRLYPRSEVALPAFLHAGGERHSVHLVDLSSGGAKLKCSQRLVVGTSVVLDCGTLARAAIVRWQSEGFVGLCFASALDARDVAALIDRSKALAAWVKGRD